MNISYTHFRGAEWGLKIISFSYNFFYFIFLLTLDVNLKIKEHIKVIQLLNFIVIN